MRRWLGAHRALATTAAIVLILSGCSTQVPALVQNPKPAPVEAPAVTAAALQAHLGYPVEARLDLPAGQLLVVGPARGAMPAVQRPVALLASTAGGLQTVNTATADLPGRAERLQQRDLPNHPGAYVITALGPRGEPRYAAVAVKQKRIETLEYYALTAPAAEEAKGAYLHVNKHLTQLWFFQEGRLVRTYPVATGEQLGGPTPTWADFKTNYFTPEGLFTIDVKRKNPIYYGSDSHPPAAGGAPDNPLGTRWMGFVVLNGDNGDIWGLHGTDEPEKIGTWVSDGCIRLNTADAEALFDLLPMGAKLRVVGK